MKIIEHNNIKHFFTFGDIHGEFKTFFNILKKGLKYDNSKYKEELHPLVEQEKYEMHHMLNFRPFSKDRYLFAYTKSIIFVCGDISIGFNKKQYYIDTFKLMNEILKENHTFLYFIRGNHDDPSYFNTDEDKLQFSNIKCLSDYSIVKLKNNTILCVGGGVSIDRIWRKQQENVINKYKKKENYKKLYWEEEMPFFNKELLSEIIENKIAITDIVSHSCPSFAFPNEKDFSQKWYEIDSKLKDDVIHEREVFDEIFNFLSANDVKIKTWSYGHFHKSFSDINKEHNILFNALNELVCTNPNDLYKQYNNLKENSFLKKMQDSGYFGSSSGIAVDELYEIFSRDIRIAENNQINQ